MAESDHTGLTGNLGGGDCATGVSEGFTPPSGGGTFVHVMRAKTATEGVFGLYYSADVNFTPQASGGHVYGAMTRYQGAGGCSPFLFQQLQSTLTTNNGYLLGLTHDEDPAHLILKKGNPDDGFASNDSGILRMSSATFANATWLHLRLDVIEQPSGDVRLKVFQNDLTAHAVTAPSWASIDGMSDFVDDVAGVATGSVPYTGGYAGWGAYMNGINRVALFDHVEIARQV